MLNMILHYFGICLFSSQILWWLEALIKSDSVNILIALFFAP